MRVRRQVYARILIKMRANDERPTCHRCLRMATRQRKQFLLSGSLDVSRFFLDLFLTNFWSTFGSLLYLQLPDHFSEARGEQEKTTRIQVTFPGRLSKVDSYDSDIKGTFQS